MQAAAENPLDPIVALASLAQGYITGRINDDQYIDAAMVLGGLSRGQATERCMALDAGSPLGKYRRARRDALRFCRSSRWAKQDGAAAIHGRTLEFWQMELVRLRRARAKGGAA